MAVHFAVFLLRLPCLRWAARAFFYLAWSFWICSRSATICCLLAWFFQSSFSFCLSFSTCSRSFLIRSESSVASFLSLVLSPLAVSPEGSATNVSAPARIRGRFLGQWYRIATPTCTVDL